MRRLGGFVLLFGAIALSGCALMRKPEVVPFNGNITKTAKVQKHDVEGNLITPSQICSEVTNVLIGGYENYEKCLIANCSYRIIDGVDSQLSGKDLIKIRYFHGTQDSGKEHVSTITADVPCVVDEASNEYTVKVSNPATINTFPTGSEIFYSQPDKINDDLVSRLNRLKIQVQRTYILKGEVDSAYGQESVYANFTRQLGLYGNKKFNKSDDIEKESIFTYAINGEKLLLHVSVFPYKKGSKTVYQMTIPYVVSDTVSISKNDIDNIKNNIAKIVNE